MCMSLLSLLWRDSARQHSRLCVSYANERACGDWMHHPPLPIASIPSRSPSDLDLADLAAPCSLTPPPSFSAARAPPSSANPPVVRPSSLRVSHLSLITRLTTRLLFPPQELNSCTDQTEDFESSVAREVGMAWTDRCIGSWICILIKSLRGL